MSELQATALNAVPLIAVIITLAVFYYWRTRKGQLPPRLFWLLLSVAFAAMILAVWLRDGAR